MIKRIKENITSKEYKTLINYTKGNDTIKENTKINLLRAFTILYYTGIRLNELQDLKIKNIKELIKQGTTKFITSKTKSERKLYITNDFKKALKGLFDTKEDDNNRIINKAGYKNTPINHIAFISQVNRAIKEILGEGYTSHSFRQGLITEMGTKSINTKIISKFIGHSSIKTTMRYINPTDEDIKGALIR